MGKALRSDWHAGGAELWRFKARGVNVFPPVEEQGDHVQHGFALTLMGVATSGLATTKGEINSMPENSLGLSLTVRMEMAPPCNAKEQPTAQYRCQHLCTAILVLEGV